LTRLSGRGEVAYADTPHGRLFRADDVDEWARSRAASHDEARREVAA
jgi:hypothetical protein